MKCSRIFSFSSNNRFCFFELIFQSQGLKSEASLWVSPIAIATKSATVLSSSTGVFEADGYFARMMFLISAISNESKYRSRIRFCSRERIVSVGICFSVLSSEKIVSMISGLKFCVL